MPNLSSFMSKPILLLFEAQLESKISGGLLNIKNKKLEYLMFGENDFNQIIAPKKIEYSGEHAIVVINNLCIKQCEDIDCSRYVFAPIGNQVFTTDGKLIGKVTDLELDSGYICTALLIDESERMPIDMVITIGDDIVLIKGEWCPKITKNVSKKIKLPKQDKIKVRILDNDNGADFDDNYPISEPISLAKAIESEIGKKIISDNLNKATFNIKQNSNLKKSDEANMDMIKTSELSKDELQNADKPQISQDIVANTLQDSAPEKANIEETSSHKEVGDLSNLADEQFESNSNSDEIIAQSEKPSAPVEVLMPTRVISDYGFLLGRLVTKNIFSYSQELIAKEGDIVTTILVDKVRNFGKLVELTLNSKY
ncbi:MAG: PRC-barrel domain-containing protein [Clostridia bacterium]|nr:PRC-barrel domain-containing protein [Clostridia bacterium]